MAPTSIRFSRTQAERLHRLARALARKNGGHYGATTIARLCVERALPLLEAELAGGEP